MDGHLPVPKLFLNGDPGALLTGPLRQQCRTWPHQREVTVPGLHFLPEDAPQQIARPRQLDSHTPALTHPVLRRTGGTDSSGKWPDGSVPGVRDSLRQSG